MATAADTSSLGTYLRDRRVRMDPFALGLSSARRRTPGLRREEVALRANISATWYTWLEQGRGGAPSAEVLHRISDALMLTDVEREHAFILGLGLPVEPRDATHFGWFARFAGGDFPTSSAHTRDTLGWAPRQRGLLADLADPAYFAR